MSNTKTNTQRDENNKNSNNTQRDNTKNNTQRDENKKELSKDGNNTNNTQLDENNTKNNNTQRDNKKEQEQSKDVKQETFRRIKIIDLPREVTRAHIDELCSKFGRITDIELRRVGNLMNSFVTFSRFVDAEFALYRLTDTIYLGSKIKAFSAELTQEDMEAREKEQKERERKKLEGREKKKKFAKPPKQSLRHLAPRNAPTTGNNNTQKGNQQVKNTQQNNQNQGGNPSRKKQNQKGNNGQGNRNQGGQKQSQSGNQQGGNQKKGGFQIQGQRNNKNNGQGNRNQGGQRQNQGNTESNRFKGKYRVKNQQSTTENYVEPAKEESQPKKDEPTYEVTVRNINTNKQLFNITLSEEGLNQYFPPEERTKLVLQKNE